MTEAQASNAQASNAYLLGHADEELARLERQAKLFAETTQQVLLKAGLRSGMRVLDLGCGAGDVSMLAARIVGEAGEVIGVDRSAPALQLASRRAAAAGLGQISFMQKELADLAADEPFDMVVGRFLLLHFAAPVPMIRGAASVLKPGGTLAFAEMDIRSTSATPPFPLLETCVGWIVSLYERAGLEPDMGSKLHRAFKSAGLTPQLTAGCRVETGLEGGGLAYLIGTLRTMKPNLIALGVATEQELDIEAIERELVGAMGVGDHCVVYPRLIGAWSTIGAA